MAEGQVTVDGKTRVLEAPFFVIATQNPLETLGTFPLPEAQMDRFWKLYESTEQITGRNDALLDIVMEQADVYFAGDKTLEETVKLIQNRASLYVNENK